MATLDKSRWDSSMTDMKAMLDNAAAKMTAAQTGLAVAQRNFDAASERLVEVETAYRTLSQSFRAMFPTDGPP